LNLKTNINADSINANININNCSGPVFGKLELSSATVKILFSTSAAFKSTPITESSISSSITSSSITSSSIGSSSIISSSITSSSISIQINVASITTQFSIF
jgi:hypothetical protein